MSEINLPEDTSTTSPPNIEEPRKPAEDYRGKNRQLAGKFRGLKRKLKRFIYHIIIVLLAHVAFETGLVVMHHLFQSAQTHNVQATTAPLKAGTGH